MAFISTPSVLPSAVPLSPIARQPPFAATHMPSHLQHAATRSSCFHSASRVSASEGAVGEAERKGAGEKVHCAGWNEGVGSASCILMDQQVEFGCRHLFPRVMGRGLILVAAGQHALARLLISTTRLPSWPHLLPQLPCHRTETR